ncbi:MAG: arginine-tRNA-protein transferase [Ignavibacteriales bacterium]|nr:arginine-tRNA-protein transferase [Ignavibacteriales bacterium]
MPEINECFESLYVSPQDLDALFERGWRHFGSLFYRYESARHDDAEYRVMPVRVDLEKFSLSKSQRRTLRRNEDLEFRHADATIDKEKEDLFANHRRRFKHSRPDSIYDFLSPLPALYPCRTLELTARSNGRLVATSFYDRAEKSLSAVYAMFDLAESRRRLGVATALMEIARAMELGKRRYYLGYAYWGESFYDYKKQFAGLEYYNWRGTWAPYDPSLEPAPRTRARTERAPAKSASRADAREAGNM